MPRLLLLLPTTTYRAEAFLGAARKLKLEVTLGSKQADRLADQHAVDVLPLNFNDPGVTARAALGLPHNPVTAVAAARNKHRMRELLRAQGVPVPRFALFSVDDDPATIAEKIVFPCVLKPISLSASCGVIRANDCYEFVAAFHR